MRKSTLLMTLLIAATCAACSDASSEESDALEVVSTTEDELVGIVFPGGHRVIEAYGTEATGTDVYCSRGLSALGATFLALPTLRGFVAAGGAGIARCEVRDRPAIGIVVAGAAVGGNAWTGSIAKAGAAIGQFRVELPRANAPRDPTAADALFDEAFGPAARHGLSLTIPIHTWGADGYRAVGTVSHEGRPVAIAVGVLRIGGRVLAVQTTGVGSFTRFVL